MITKTFLLLLILLLLSSFLIAFSQAEYANGSQLNKKKKDIRDYTDADLERLYEQWEENDDDGPLTDDEKPEHLRPRASVDFEQLRAAAGDSPEALMRMSKKGQTLMMFASVVDPSRRGERAKRAFTERTLRLWQTSLNNNHVDVQVYVVDDDRLLFMFRDGAQAWDSRDFLLKQPECKEVVLEGKTSLGAGSEAKGKSIKEEL